MSTTQGMHRRPCVGGAEVDAFSRSSQRALAWRPGERAGITRGARRRERRSTRQALRASREG